MGDMVTIVALGIWSVRGGEDGPSRDDCLKMARAAIEAMRKPTEAMLTAVDECPDDASGNWDTMIYAALNEDTGK